MPGLVLPLKMLTPSGWVEGHQEVIKQLEWWAVSTWVKTGHAECMESGNLTQALRPGKEVLQGQGCPCCSEGFLSTTQMQAIRMKGNEVRGGGGGEKMGKNNRNGSENVLCFRNSTHFSKRLIKIEI